MGERDPLGSLESLEADTPISSKMPREETECGQLAWVPERLTCFGMVHLPFLSLPGLAAGDGPASISTWRPSSASNEIQVCVLAPQGLSLSLSSLETVPGTFLAPSRHVKSEIKISISQTSKLSL